MSGTRAAHPYWHFLDRRRADPIRYPLRRAWADYRTQPRILAMNTHNATPHGGLRLPTSALEALQAGYRAYLTPCPATPSPWPAAPATSG